MVEYFVKLRFDVMQFLNEMGNIKFHGFRKAFAKSIRLL